jgi:hypothetical protein
MAGASDRGCAAAGLTIVQFQHAMARYSVIAENAQQPRKPCILILWTGQYPDLVCCFGHPN